MSIKKQVKLTSQQRQYLEKYVTDQGVTSRKLNRAWVLLLSDEGNPEGARTDHRIAKTLGVSMATVARIRHQFVEEGLQAALNDKPRSGRPPRITKKQQAQVVALARSEPPKGRKRWSLRLLAAKVEEMGIVDTISYKTVGEILKKTNLTCA